MSLPDTSVKVFSSDMSGAPSLYGAAGRLIAVLDACLVNGFGSVTLNSLVVSGNVATGTVSTGHGFTLIGSTGPVIRVSGATPVALNGDWRIASIPNTTTFTFAVEGIADGTATGTITAKRAPAGWTKLFSGTNKAVYARSAPEANAMVLRIDDTPTQYPTVIMYESMTDVDTGTAPTPTTGSLYFGKSSAASSADRPWRLFADPRFFSLHGKSDGAAWYAGLYFGDLVAFNSTDRYATYLNAHPTATSTNSAQIPASGYQAGGYLARPYSQAGSAVSAAQASHNFANTSLSTGMPFPNPCTGALHIAPVDIWDYASNYVVRGYKPGAYCPIHLSPGSGGVQDGLVTKAPLISSYREFLAQATYATSAVTIYDITGPWR